MPRSGKGTSREAQRHTRHSFVNHTGHLMGERRSVSRRRTASGIRGWRHVGLVGRGTGSHDRRKLFEFIHSLIVHVVGLHLIKSGFVLSLDLGGESGHESIHVGGMTLRTGRPFLFCVDGLE